MQLVRIALLASIVVTAYGCRAIGDDQETRPLPPPEPPPDRTTQARASDRPRSEGSPRPSPPRSVDAERPSPAERPTTTIAERPTTAEDRPTTAATAPPAEEPRDAPPLPAEPGSPPPEAQPAADGACLARCQGTLAACVTAPSDAGGALEGCKSAFEACKSGC